MKSKDSNSFFVKLYLDEIEELKVLHESSGEPTPTALKLLFAKADLYFTGKADYPADSPADSPAEMGARIIWIGMSRRTLADREHRETLSITRSNARKGVVSNDNNCNQMKSNDNNCNQMKSNDTINRINREGELVEEKEQKEKKEQTKEIQSYGQSPTTDVQEKVVGKPYSIDEVERYAKELSTTEKLSGRPSSYYGKRVEQYVEGFYTYWESAGWKRRGSTVKDWKASFRNWCLNEFNRPTKYSNNSQSDTVRYILATNVDTGDAYKDPDAFGTVLNKHRAEREQNNNN